MLGARQDEAPTSAAKGDWDAQEAADAGAGDGEGLNGHGQSGIGACEKGVYRPGAGRFVTDRSTDSKTVR
jgi:hypothetical protein